MGAPKYHKGICFQIAKEYKAGMTTGQLREKYGYKTNKSITDKLKQAGITKEDMETNRKQQRKYSLDFNHLDSFTSYLLGLLATDGYLSPKDNGVGIELTDEDCIKSISEYTGQDYHSYDKTKYTGVLDNGQIINTKKQTYRIMFYGQDIYQQVIDRGITPSKSLSISSIKIYDNEEIYYPYIIRGIIDGDGSIYNRSSDSQLCLSICSASKDFLEWVKWVLEDKMFFYDVHIYTKEYSDRATMYKLFTSDSRNMILLYLLSYYLPMGMQRKRKKLLEGYSETIIKTADIKQQNG